MAGWHEVYEEKVPEIRDMARSVCAVCDGGAPTKGGKVLGTGFLIAPDRVATARHVVLNGGPPSFLYCAFGYYKLTENQEDFPDLKSPRAGLLDDGGSNNQFSTDWAILGLLDLAGPLGINPLEVSSETFSAKRMIVIGYPEGGQAKISDICSVEDESNASIGLDLTSHEGASGGPAFNFANKVVEGILRVKKDDQECKCIKTSVIVPKWPKADV